MMEPPREIRWRRVADLTTGGNVASWMPLMDVWWKSLSTGQYSVNSHLKVQHQMALMYTWTISGS